MELQSENDHATGTYFPIGTGLYNLVNLRFHWDQVPVPAKRMAEQDAMVKFLTWRSSGQCEYVVIHVIGLGLISESVVRVLSGALRHRRFVPSSRRTPI
jgi:hypothetical protein